MDVRHLRHFLAVAEELHMGRAARRLGMAQPPLSQSIARLEQRLGVRLFDRANRRLTLTAAGAAMIEDARAAVSHADKAANLALAAAVGRGGNIRIGFVSAALYEELPDLLARMKRHHPDIRPRLVEMSTNDQIDALAENVIDIGFAHPPIGTTTAIQMLELSPEDLVAALPDDAVSERVTLSEIARRGLVLFPASQGPVLHARILDAFTTAGLTLPPIQEAARALTMLSLVSAGLGVALLPRSTKRLQFKGVRFAEIEERDALPRMTLAVIARRRPRSPVIDTILHLMQEAGQRNEMPRRQDVPPSGVQRKPL